MGAFLFNVVPGRLKRTMKKRHKRKLAFKARELGSNEQTSSQIPPGTRFVSQEVVDYLMESLLHSLARASSGPGDR